MNGNFIRPLLIALLLSLSLVVIACGNEGEEVAVANKNANTSASASPAATMDPSKSGKTPATGLVGYIDNVDCAALVGWVLNREHPEQPVNLEIYVDDKLQSVLKGGQFRKDLLDAGIGSGNYGFSYPIPINLKDGRRHMIKVKVQNTNYEPEFYKSTPGFIICNP